MKPSLDNIRSPKDIKAIPVKQLPELAEEIRRRIIDVTSKNGGHIAPSLGAVEITIALHYVLDAPKDKILWDVGHQAYAHKLITGRVKRFHSLRQLGGISGFPNKNESVYDSFTVGHSSTSISQGLGLASARDIRAENYHVVSVIGDAALASGMALEALNNAGQLKKDYMIVLNDNEHSISKSVGALSSYLNRILSNPLYNKVREDMQRLVKRVPIFGFRALKAARKLEEAVKNLMVPGILFEELGLRYFGPIDGHNISELINTFNNVIKLKEPRIVHVITRKGKGYRYSEENPTDFHGKSPFDTETGLAIKTGPPDEKARSFSDVFGKKLTELAEKDGRIAAITAAMRDGTGLMDFAEKFPDRFFDVGIAEQHAVTFGAALAKGGLRPVVAIYSTFLQRAYDQIIHDVSLQDLPVVFCLDRAGLSGEDGPTHHGMFDIAYMRHIPNIICMAPRDGFELEAMLELALKLDTPVSIRYAKGSASSNIAGATFEPLDIGKSEVIRQGKDLAIIAVGSMVGRAVKAADLLSQEGIESEVINARFIKPIDSEMVNRVASKFKRIVTIEEGVRECGFGSAVSEHLEREFIKGARLMIIGLPNKFIEHGKRKELLNKYNLNADGISETIKGELFGK